MERSMFLQSYPGVHVWMLCSLYTVGNLAGTV